MNDQPYGIAALDRRRRLARAGRIRLGEKQVSVTGKEYPKELDYFNLTDAPKVAELYGKEPRELDIIFPSKDPQAILDICYMMYGSTGPKCRGNGSIANHWERDEEIDCAGEDCQMVAEKRCKRQGRLTFICYRVPGLCVYDIVTSSWRSIENCLALIETLQDLFGRIDGIPLKLYREPYTISYVDDDGKQHSQEHHCIRLDVAASLLDVKRLVLGGGEKLELEPAPLECADDIYPKSIQEVQALPAANGGELPPPASSPNIDVDLRDRLLDGISEDLREEIKQGFEICEQTEDKQLQLLERYKDQPDKLLGYLSAMVDAALRQNQ